MAPQRATSTGRWRGRVPRWWGRAPRSARAAVAACVVAAVGVSGCSRERTAPPTFEPRIVVHAVLDPSVAEQLILVERTNVAATVPRGALVARDLVASAGGSPVSGAIVSVIGARGDTVRAIEDRATRSDGSGAGMYRLRSVVRDASDAPPPVGVLALVPGATYRLEVRTSLGIVRGTTRMPRFPAVADRGTRRFDLDRDTLRAAEPPTRVGAAAFVVRHLFAGYASSTRIVPTMEQSLLRPALRGDDAWAFAPSRDAIWPGTTQSFAIAAVDANFLRYSITGADPFGDDIRGNTLQGGVGLFGAVATLTDVTLELVSEPDHAIEGDWVALGASAGLPVTLRLWESPNFSARAGDTLALTGSARLGTSTSLVAQARLVGGTLTMTLAPSPNAANTRRYVGTFARDTITLQSVGSQVRVRYRQPP